MFEPLNILIVAATFLLAGTVKGVIGLGLPTISLALLTATIGLHPAMALMLAPSLVSNIWQAALGGGTGVIVKRIWPFLLAAMLTVWFGSAALVSIEVSYLTALLGVLLVVYSTVALSRPHLSLPAPWEKWAGPLLGCLNGVLTGMTGTFVFPGVLYLQALGLARDRLVQAMGILFTCSTAALAVSLGGRHLLSLDLGSLSAASVIPTLAGMMLGQRIRRKIPETVFRQVFFISLLLLGLYLSLK